MSNNNLLISYNLRYICFNLMLNIFCAIFLTTSNHYNVAFSNFKILIRRIWRDVWDEKETLQDVSLVISQQSSEFLESQVSHQFLLTNNSSKYPNIQTRNTSN